MASGASGLSKIIEAAPEFSQPHENAGKPDLATASIPPNGLESRVAASPEDTVSLSGFAPRAPKYPITNPLTQGQTLTSSSNTELTPARKNAGSSGPQNFAASTKAQGISNNLLTASPQTTSLGLPKSTATPVSEASGSVPALSLQHLDETLQQIGINPFSISIVRREALLSLANDPSALVQYFQTSPSNTPQSTQFGSPAQQTTNSPSDGTNGGGTVSQTSPETPQPPHVDITA